MLGRLAVLGAAGDPDLPERRALCDPPGKMPRFLEAQIATPAQSVRRPVAEALGLGARTIRRCFSNVQDGGRLRSSAMVWRRAFTQDIPARAIALLENTATDRKTVPIFRSSRAGTNRPGGPQACRQPAKVGCRFWPPIRCVRFNISRGRAASVTHSRSGECSLCAASSASVTGFECISVQSLVGVRSDRGVARVIASSTRT